MKLLEKEGLLKQSKNKTVKILGNGDLTKKIIIDNLLISKAAAEKVEKNGGKIL